MRFPDKCLPMDSDHSETRDEEVVALASSVRAMHNGDPQSPWPTNRMVPEVSGRCTAKHDGGKAVSQVPDDVVAVAVAVLQVSDNFSVAVEMPDQVQPSGATFYYRHRS